MIAATNRDLETSYREGLFRKDLYFRLNVVAVNVPSLRERRSDIPQLAHCFLDRYAPGEGIQITPAAMKSFLQYDWPGNVRELENCIARAVALGDHHTDRRPATCRPRCATCRIRTAKDRTRRRSPPRRWPTWNG